jgi:DNA (cytosine-5)-methyltransferase 1
MRASPQIAKELKSRRPVFLDLFAGCGGMSLGLEQAGWKPLAFTEINDDAAASYLKNRQTDPPEHFDTNAALLRHSSEFKNIDLVCGGPPCQGFSFRGHRRTQHVRRDSVPANSLYKEMIRVISKIKPKLFLLENVYGMVRSRWNASSQHTVFETVYHDFIKKLNREYVISADVLRSCDYRVPQLRRRVFLVGISRELRQFEDPRQLLDPFVARKLGLLPHPPELPYQDLDPVDVIGDLVDPAYSADPGAVIQTDKYPLRATTPFQKEMRTVDGSGILGRGAALSDHVYSRHRPETRHKYSELIRNDGDLPLRYQTKKFKLTLLPRVWPDRVPKITITSLADDFVHFEQARTLTVRECARFQTFPDSYEFVGKRTTGGERRAGRPADGIWDRDLPKYTQIANAVPVRLAAELGKHLRGLLA